MKHTLANRLMTLVLASASALLISTGALAAPTRALNALDNRGPASAAQLPNFAKAESGITGTLNPGALSAPVLDLTLADGTVIEARLQRVARDATKGTQSWVGTFTDAPGSALILSKAKGVVTGFANYKDQVLEIVPTTGGKHVLYAIDESKLPKGEIMRPAPKFPADTLTGTSTGSTGSSTLTSSSAVVQDVMVLYTAATATRYGQASIESQIQSAIQAANQAYANSLVNITLNLVYVGQSSIVEQSNMDSTVNVLQSDPTVANQRNAVGADMVVLVSENSDYCGLSNLMTSNSASFAPYAFGVVYSSCLSNQSLAHEVGHQQGLMHDRADSAGWAGVYPYSYGYQVCVTDGTGFRDIMSYPCSGVPRVLIFSNPYITYNGYPAGIAYETSPSTSAENARSLNNTATTVAAFRTSTSSGSTSTAPAAPTGLTNAGTTYSQVNLAWTDNSTNETGYKIERSGDGVNFSEIATLGAGSNGYADVTVAASTNYYYRVRAYNSAGASAYSNTLAVTTPAIPPPPPAAPTSVAALNDADGTATVSWTPGSSNATSFDVLRQTWNARKSTWGSATIAATVPASVVSIVDASGTGTYQYSVRANNSGGSSAYAGPAQVSVTNSTTTSTRGKRK